MFKFKRMNRFNVKGGVLENPVALTSLHRHYGVTRGPKGYRAQHPTPKGENALSHPDTTLPPGTTVINGDCGPQAQIFILYY